MSETTGQRTEALIGLAGAPGQDVLDDLRADRRRQAAAIEVAVTCVLDLMEGTGPGALSAETIARVAIDYYAWEMRPVR